MDKLSNYSNYVKQLLSQYVSAHKKNNAWEIELIFDEQKFHYLWLNVGWQGSNRIYYTVIHFDIKKEKIWLQKNDTDLDPAEDLVNLGVPREDIILGLQPPHKRPYTNYGVG
jgi:XisI protein